MNWVDTAQMIGAVATAGALIFVGFQTKYSRDAAGAAQRMHELESARDAKALEMETRRQASQVTAWPVKLRTDEGWVWGIVISNPSHSPVFDLALTRSENRTKKDRAIAPLGVRAEVLPTGGYFVGESDRWVNPLPSGVDIIAITGNANYMPELRFRDSDGRMWTRDCDGVLTRIAST